MIRKAQRRKCKFKKVIIQFRNEDSYDEYLLQKIEDVDRKVDIVRSLTIILGERGKNVGRESAVLP